MTQPQEQQRPAAPAHKVMQTQRWAGSRQVILEHNFGDPIRVARPADAEICRALAKQRKKILRRLLKSRAKLLPFPVQPPITPSNP